MSLYDVATPVGRYLEPAMELTGDQMTEIFHGRKIFFDRFYFTLAANLPRKEQQFFRHVSKYRDKNVEILSTPYMTNFTVFGEEDKKILFEVTGIDRKAVDAAISETRKHVKDECKLRGYSSPASLFENLTSERVVMTLMMRFYIERGGSSSKQKLQIVSAYMGYSMFFSNFSKFFKYGVRPETMVYTINTLTNKHKLKQLGTVDGLLGYGVEKCVETYRQKIIDCTDNDVIYLIQQFKSRLRGYFRDIANKYYENDAKKEAVFSSSDTMVGPDEDGASFVERESTAGKVEQLASTYTTNFFQRPIDDGILDIVARMNQVARPELKNALTQIRNDNSQIPILKRFYESLFYLYTAQAAGAVIDVKSRRFLAVMDSIYKKGNSKEKNLTYVKSTLDDWLTQFSQVYREANRMAKINSYRKAIYQYFVFIVVLR